MSNGLRMQRLFGCLAVGCLCIGLVLMTGCPGNPTTPGDGGTTPPPPTHSGPYTCNKDNVCVLTGTITENLTLTADKKWLLRGGVFIGDDSTPTVLTIEPGTTIFGEAATNGMLVIRRGAQIKAEGTKDKPIVFTSSKPKGSRARGDWGGLIINGRAKINACADKASGKCEAFGEGGTGFYGGDKDDDNSGVLRYVRVEFAGRLISPDNELNGVAFQGVGSGTVVEYLQVHMAKDDGVEFYGGTVGVKYVLVTGVADDSLDWTDGWRGKAQFIILQQYDDAGDNGIEADNNGEDNTATPRSRPTISNITLIGSPQSKASDLGMLLREGTAARISNAIVHGFNEGCIKLDHKETFENAAKGGKLTGELTITHALIKCATNFVEKDGMPYKTEDFVMKLNADNQIVEPKLRSPFDLSTAGLMPASGSPALSGAKVPSDAFFTQVKFIGGIGDDDWTAGWTTQERK